MKIRALKKKSTDEDPGLRIESFAIIKLCGVTTEFKIFFFTMQTLKELIKIPYFNFISQVLHHVSVKPFAFCSAIH